MENINLKLLKTSFIVDARRLFLDDFYREAESFMSEMRNKLRIQKFSFSAPEAQHVYVVGDFNNCKADDYSRLDHMPDGIWEKRMALKPGTYKYKFRR